MARKRSAVGAATEGSHVVMSTIHSKDGVVPAAIARRMGRQRLPRPAGHNFASFKVAALKAMKKREEQVKLLERTTNARSRSPRRMAPRRCRARSSGS